MAEKLEKNTEDNKSNPYDQYTNNALIDVILFQISSKKKNNTDGGKPRNSYWAVDGDDTLEWVNLKYAYYTSIDFFSSNHANHLRFTSQI